MTSNIVVVAGASGGFGRRVAEAFEAAGWEVRRYRRGTDLAECARGADLIVNGLNPPMYHNWPVLVPRITRQVIDAARETGAAILLPGTVYLYGAQPGPWTEATPHVGGVRKGRIRAEMEATYRDASERYGLRVIVLRLGDFIDPSNPATLFNMVVLKWLRGNLMVTLSPGRVVRAYAHLPDAGRAAVALAERREALPRFAEINMPGLHFSMTALQDEITRQTGRRIRRIGFPWWALRLAAPLHEMSRELLEMRYLYRLDHWLESTRFGQELPGFEMTPFAEVVRQQIDALNAGRDRPRPGDGATPARRLRHPEHSGQANIPPHR